MAEQRPMGAYSDWNRPDTAPMPDPSPEERGRDRQIAFMECREDDCKGSGNWFNDSGNREWFVSEGAGDQAWNCPECGRPGTRYPY